MIGYILFKSILTKSIWIKMILMKTEEASMFIGRERELASLKEFSDISIVNNFIDSSSADRYINK